MKHRSAGALGVAALCLALATDAGACGGCFTPVTQTEDSVVTGHRMAFAFSPERTVLWDQFEYSGSPEEFSWVLPVAPGAYLEEARDAWFESLETVTQTQVSSPTVRCASNSGFGCGGLPSSAKGSALSDDGIFSDNGVVVLHRGTVGPYDTVTLRSTGGDTLTRWLTDNGYYVPEDITPIIDAYVTEGSDFIALKLRPGEGIQQMTPVRVVTPHGDPVLPLRMVSAGTGPFVDIVLYVIAEERYGMPDLHEAFVDTKELVWDFGDQTSNYAKLREAALKEFEGNTYLTTFSEQEAFSKQHIDPNGFPITYRVDENDYSGYRTLAELYFGQARSSAASSTADSCSSVLSALRGTALVVEDGTTSAGANPGSRAFECAGYTDLAAAMIGMHPANVWLTRLEMRLPRESLVRDCVLEPSEDQSGVDNRIQARKASGRPANCPQAIFESRIARGATGNRTALFLGLGTLLAVGLRRRFRRKAHGTAARSAS